MSRLQRFCAMALLSLAATSVAAKPGLFEPATADPVFLPVDQAFEIQPLELGRDGKLHMGWRIAPGYFLYRPRIRIQVVTPDDLALEGLQLPAGRLYEDELFGSVEVYGAPSITLPVLLKGDLPRTLTLKISYQGCAEAGLCYPPQERLLEWGGKP